MVEQKELLHFCTFFARTHEQNLSVVSSGALIETAIIHNQMDNGQDEFAFENEFELRMKCDPR